VKIYAALLKPDSEPVLVREGFAWGALFLGPLWLAVHRAWIAAAISLAAYVLLAALAPGPADAILAVGLALILGFTGHDLRCWATERRGYLLAHVLAAGDQDDAFARLLNLRPDLAVRYRPEPT
jgi:Protein of unknown function (DUF2628)